MAGPAVDALRVALVERMDRWSSSSVRDALSLAPEFRVAPRPLLDILAAMRDPLVAWLENSLRDADDPDRRTFEANPAAFLATRFLIWLQSRNQYLDLSAEFRQDVRRAYVISASALKTTLIDASTSEQMQTAVEAVLEDHQRRIAALLDQLARSPIMPRPDFMFREAVCGSYSVQLQLDLLGLDVSTLQEPILDLGCGEQASLVRRLRDHGLVALGIDRVAQPDSAPWTISGDWFALTLPPRTFGSILSHLALSQHFLHQHLRGGSAAQRYAHKYVEILRALRPNGVFAYAPALPFIEDLLPTSQWRVTRSEIHLPSPSLVRADLALEVPFGSTRIQRLP